MVAVALAATASCGSTSGLSTSSENVVWPRALNVATADFDTIDKVAFIGNSVASQLRTAAEVMVAEADLDVEVVSLLFEPVVRIGDPPSPFGYPPEDIVEFLVDEDPDVVVIQATFAVPGFRCVGDDREIRRCRIDGMRQVFGQRLRDIAAALPEQLRTRVVWPTLSVRGSLTDSIDDISLAAYDAADVTAWDLARDGIWGMVRSGYDLALDGQYANVDGRRILYRDQDGIHYCAAGGFMVVNELFAAIDPSWTPPPEDTVTAIARTRDFDRQSWGEPTCDG